MTEESRKMLVIENIAIFIAVAVCTASVAYFAESAWGLLSMLMCHFINNTMKGTGNAASKAGGR